MLAVGSATNGSESAAVPVLMRGGQLREQPHQVIVGGQLQALGGPICIGSCAPSP